MKRCSKCLTEKSIEDFYRNKQSRDGHSSECKRCVIARAKEWYGKNSKRKKRNPPWTREQFRAYDRKRNKERRQTEKWREYWRASFRRWAKRHPEQGRKRCALRRLTVAQATPKWASKFIISEAYHLAVLREKKTGIKWHVDHIVPLNNPSVCGLHTHANLQILESRSNVAKSNRVWPDMPE